MNNPQILQYIDAEIERLRQARQLLGGVDTHGFTATGRPHRDMSAAARARISAAQKARWAKRKGTSTAVSGSTGRKRRHMSAEARARIAAAQKKRWARVKAQKKK